MKKSLILASMLISSSLFANEIYNDLIIGGYHVKEDNKPFIGVDSNFFQNAIMVFPSIEAKNEFSGFGSKEQYRIGEGYSSAEWQLFYKNFGINVGYIDVSNNNMDGAYGGLVYADKIFEGDIAISYAPITSGDLKSVSKIEFSYPIIKKISLGMNYTIYSQNKTTETVIVEGKEFTASGYSREAVTQDKDVKDAQIGTIFVKIPF